MTDELDFIRLYTTGHGTLNLLLVDIGLEWPPPEFIIWDDELEEFRESVEGDDKIFVYQRTNMSLLTDVQLAGMPYMVRGAEYHYKGSIH